MTTLVAGAGLAGLIAAHAAQREGAAVLVVDRGPIGMGTNSALANGVMSGPSERYRAEDFVRDTLRAGSGLNRTSRVRLLAREAPSGFQILRSVGIPLKERGTQKTVASPDPSVIPGVTLMRKLADHVRGLDNVHALPEPRLAATWSNKLQKLAERTRLGIPVTAARDGMSVPLPG